MTKYRKINLEDEDLNHPPLINMVPLIDVMLVLLVIFMMTASVALMPIPLNLPKHTSQEMLKSQPIILKISIPEQAIDTSSQNIMIYVNQSKITLNQLKSQLQLFKKDKNISPLDSKSMYQIEIYADQKAYYHSLSKVLAILQEENLTKIQFVLQQS
jgi:biopolymer transport protein ExbD